MFFGTHLISLTADGRFSMPEAYRYSSGQRWYFLPGFDNNLLLMREDIFEKIGAQTRQMNLTDPLVRLLNRFLYASAESVEMDAEGRLCLPPTLRSLLGANDRLILTGQGEYLELWSPERWNEQLTRLQEAQANARNFEKYTLSLA
jgi:MraZ protein